MITELLAPAKNLEIAKCAIDCGADAVYIGSVSFGARQNASNSIDDIEELVKYAHKFYVKVYVTVNTIIADNELDDVKNLINKLYAIGVDALIIQDMSILEMSINGAIAPIPLHISTQCDNRLEEKIEFFDKMGVSRVVLARELSLDKIKYLKQKFPNLEFETFIHGALCVSYSGQCYLSCHIGGRSANRGECAQPCRKKYSLIDDKGNILVENKHLLSLKDFNASEAISELVDVGVFSFKIEGRLKDKLYVKNVVSFYRKLLDKYSTKSSSGVINYNFEPDLYKSFNRGYTDYFLYSRKKCFNFNSPKFIGEKIGIVQGIKNKSIVIKLNKNIVVNSQDGLCFDNLGENGCLVNKVENNVIYPNKMPKNIHIGDSIYRNINFKFEKEVLTANTKRKINFDITYYKNIITAVDEDENTVKIDIKETDYAKNLDKMKESFINAFAKTGNTDFILKNIDIKTTLPFIPMSNLNEYRRNIINLLMQERLNNYKREIQQPLKYAKYPFEHIDYRGNVHNNLAKKFYGKCSSNVEEMSFESKRPQRQVELMRTKHCLKYAMNVCKKNMNLSLKDEFGEIYPLKFDCKNCEMVILSPYNKTDYKDK